MDDYFYGLFYDDLFRMHAFGQDLPINSLAGCIISQHLLKSLA